MSKKSGNDDHDGSVNGEIDCLLLPECHGGCGAVSGKQNPLAKLSFPLQPSGAALTAGTRRARESGHGVAWTRDSDHDHWHIGTTRIIQVL